MMEIKQRMIQWAKQLKRDLIAIYIAMKNPKTPWYARAMALIVVGYAFSPIDLIPDFIPILGYLDDALLLPIGIAITIRLIPPDILAEARKEAAEMPPVTGHHRVVTLVIVFLWLLLILWLVSLFNQ